MDTDWHTVTLGGIGVEIGPARKDAGIAAPKVWAGGDIGTI
jgi:hypothetical protein